MSDEKLNMLLAALSATPYTDQASRDAILYAMECVAASGTPTQRAETTGSVGEADGGPAPKGDAQ